MRSKSFFFFNLFSKDDKWSLLKFVVAISDFRCTNDYIWQTICLVNNMLRIDDE